MARLSWRALPLAQASEPVIHDSCCTCYDFNPIHMQKCWCTGTTCDTLIPLSNYPRASLDSCQFFNSNGAETVINFGRIFSSIVETNFPSPSAREIIVDGVARMPCFLAIHIRSQLRNGLGLARCQRLSLWQTFARYTCWISVLNPYSLYGIFALLARDENFISFSPILFYVNAT